MYKLVFNTFRTTQVTKPEITSAHAAKVYGDKNFKSHGRVVEVTDLKTKLKTTFED